MRDVRFRILTVILLSLAAFYSVAGAVAVLVWWVFFSNRSRSLPDMPVAAGSIVLVGIVAVMLEFLSGTGISYAIRMIAIILIAMWLWSEHQPGEFLSFWVWLCGRRVGFEIGLVSELALQSCDSFVRDLGRLKVSWAIKGQQIGIHNLISACTILITGALSRGQDTAELLAIRGYRYGGSHCPVFTPAIKDLTGCGAALVAALVSVIPVGEFFILL